MRTFLLPLSLLAIAWPAHANPLPQGRIIGVQGTPEQICAMSARDSNTWTLSGAGFLLDNFIDTYMGMNGGSAMGWVNRFDTQSTPGGFESNLNCLDLTASGNCPHPPSSPCNQFNPVQYRFVREAMATAYSILRSYKEQLRDEIIDQILAIPEIISDFGPPAAGADVFGIVSGALGVASGVAAKSPILSGSLGVLSGIFNILGALPDDSVSGSDISGDIQTRLRMVFASIRNQIDTLGLTLFGGTSDTSMLARISPPSSNMEKTNIAKYFSGGRFLVSAADTNLGAEIGDQIRMWGVMIRQALIIRSLSLQRFSIWIDTRVGAASDCRPTGSRFINGQCYQIIRQNKNFAGGSQGPEDIAPDQAVKLDGKYGLNVEQFYLNAEACQNANPDGNGDVQPECVE
ncbi:hypothetical protein ABW20_dc0108721 [Dactylellina cionopaga]|nr:hypothetical protein ABW20_dc0108721 [Dactylellina cionopaga]